jgi:hypothetical protein
LRSNPSCVTIVPMPEAMRLGINWDNPDQPLQVAYPEKKETGQLARNFGLIPFDVFHVTTATWATRKYKWINDLNLKGELGRDSDVAEVTGDVQIKSYPGQERLQAMQRGDIVPGGGGPNSVRRKAANQVSNLYGPAADSNGVLTPEQQSALGAYSAPGGSVVARGDGSSSLAGTSVFDPVLCEVGYRWFCPKGGSILDPFAGGATRGIVAAWLGYQYTGVEIRQGQVDANNAQVATIKEMHDRRFAAEIAAGTWQPMPVPQWITGDSTDIDELLPIGEEYDFCFSCPPYYNLEVYSTKDGDGSQAQTYEEFMVWYEGVYRQCVNRLRDNRFLMITVGDIRNKSGIGRYYNFCEDTLLMFDRKLGLITYNKAVLYTALGSLPIRTSAAFPSGRKLGHTYQQCYVFWKGQDKNGAIREALGELTPQDFSAASDINANAQCVEE